MKLEKNLNPNVKMDSKEMRKEASSPRYGYRTMDQESVDDIRPTTPGHSPGVVHSQHD